MPSERVMWLVWREGFDRCYQAGSPKEAWRGAKYAEDMAVKHLKEGGWRCDKITVKEKDDE